MEERNRKYGHLSDASVSMLHVTHCSGNILTHINYNVLVTILFHLQNYLGVMFTV